MMRSLFGIPLPERKGMKKGGQAVPRKTVIANQPHMLAYINPEEERLLYAAGGSGDPGPGGIPAFSPRDYMEERTGTGAYAYDDTQSGDPAITTAAAIDDNPGYKDVSITTSNDNDDNKINLEFYTPATEFQNYAVLPKEPTLVRFPSYNSGSAVQKAAVPVVADSNSNSSESAASAAKIASGAVPYAAKIASGAVPYLGPYGKPDSEVLQGTTAFGTAFNKFMALRNAMTTDLSLGLAGLFGGEEGVKKRLSDMNPGLTEEQLDEAFNKYRETGKETAIRARDAQQNARSNEDPLDAIAIDAVVPKCPEGHTYDEEQQMCVLDRDPFPDMIEGSSVPTTGIPVVNNQYTQFAAPTLAGLPSAAPNGFVMPTMNTQPITVPSQGLAGLQQQIQRNAGMRIG